MHSLRRHSMRGRLAAGLALLACLSLATAQTCYPVASEFVLTGLSNANGNAVNHELGVCLPAFTMAVTADCTLTLTPQGRGNAAISLLSVGAAAGQLAPLPRATDAAASIRSAVEQQAGYYYLQPTACPSSYRGTIKGAALNAGDVAALLRATLKVPQSVLPSAAFTANGMQLSWLTSGAQANTLSYTAISRTGGPTLPNFAAAAGQASTADRRFCPLLDINATPDEDSGSGVATAASQTLVARVPKQIPGTSRYVCAIAPAGGLSSVDPGTAADASTGLVPRYVAAPTNYYSQCKPGTYSYKLGALFSSDSSQRADSCVPCFRGSASQQGATLCPACPAGQYQPAAGQRACQPCLYGYSVMAGALRCMACFYGRPYCSEGWSNDQSKFTCNVNRLPPGYSPAAGFSTVKAAADPLNGASAAQYIPMFAGCSVDAGEPMMFNVSAMCQVSWFALGDTGRGGRTCSQSPAANSVAAVYTSPITVAGLSTPASVPGLAVGMTGQLSAAGLGVRLFSVSPAGGAIPLAAAAPTTLTLQLPQSGWSYLGGGDNGMGSDALGGIEASGDCPAGTVKTLVNGDGQQESTGNDPSQLLAYSCAPCPPGSFCDGSGAAKPAKCPAGTFGAVVGATSAQQCTNCPVGTYNNVPGASQCRACASGSFSSAPGATSCSGCGDGFEMGASGSNICDACRAGWFRDAATSSTCQQCPAGTSSPAGSGSCTVCTPGTFSKAPGSPVCTSCPRGTYQPSYGAQRCLPCPAGQYAFSRGRASCSVCPSGTYQPNAMATSSFACLSCPVGTAAPSPGSAKCQPCGKGFFTNQEASTQCSACSSGSFTAAAGSSQCQSCPMGSYALGAAQPACYPCKLGTYAPMRGMARCLTCQEGTYASSGGASTCTACPVGTFSAALGAQSKATCAACPAGSFGFTAAATQCQQCAPGSYTAGGGQTNCVTCPLGTYAPEAGSIRCLPCRGGYTTAGLGSTSSQDCSVSLQLNGRR